MAAFLTDGVVTLRPVATTDLEQLAEWRNDPELRQRTRGFRPLTLVQQERWFEAITAPASTDFMFVIEKASKGPRPMRLGVCGLVHWAPRERTAETSFYLGRVDQRKKKYTRRALTLLHRWGYEELDLERIWAEVYAFNGPGLSFLISLGFTEEGRLRSHVFRAGQRHDSVLLGQLRQEFK